MLYSEGEAARKIGKSATFPNIPRAKEPCDLHSYDQADLSAFSRLLLLHVVIYNQWSQFGPFVPRRIVPRRIDIHFFLNNANRINISWAETDSMWKNQFSRQTGNDTILCVISPFFYPFVCIYLNIKHDCSDPRVHWRLHVPLHEQAIGDWAFRIRADFAFYSGRDKSVV